MGFRSKTEVVELGFDGRWQSKPVGWMESEKARAKREPLVSFRWWYYLPGVHHDLSLVYGEIYRGLGS